MSSPASWSAWLRPSRPFHVLLLAAILVGLSSCGWQLRGQGDEASSLAELSGIYISANNGNLVAEALRSQLSFRDISLLERPTENGLALLLEPMQSDQRVQTVSGDLRARQIRLQLNISFNLYNYRAELLTSESMQAVRSFAQNPLEPTSIDRQRELLEVEMAEQLATNIIRLMSQYALAAREDQG